MWLPWEYGIALAAILFVISRVLPHRSITPFIREGSVVAALYGLWQLAGQVSLLSIDNALARGAAIWDFERAIGLPSELALQQWLLPHSLTTQTANLYYAFVHVPAMVAFLAWLFVRFRHAYPTWRNTLAIVTGVSLLIQLLPVAPPRLTGETQMIDTGLAYGQSLYGVFGRGIAGQLQAMPSVHVAWAALIGWAVWEISSSRWRVLGPLHFAITFLVVAVTGHHYWLDGLAAIALLLAARWTGEWLHSASRKPTPQLRKAAMPMHSAVETAV